MGIRRPLAEFSVLAMSAGETILVTGDTGTYVMIQVCIFGPVLLLAWVVFRGPSLFSELSAVREPYEKLLVGVPILGRLLARQAFARAFEALGHGRNLTVGRCRYSQGSTPRTPGTTHTSTRPDSDPPRNPGMAPRAVPRRRRGGAGCRSRP